MRHSPPFLLNGRILFWDDEWGQFVLAVRDILHRHTHALRLRGERRLHQEVAGKLDIEIWKKKEKKNSTRLSVCLCVCVSVSVCVWLRDKWRHRRYLGQRTDGTSHISDHTLILRPHTFLCINLSSCPQRSHRHINTVVNKDIYQCLVLCLLSGSDVFPSISGGNHVCACSHLSAVLFLHAVILFLASYHSLSVVGVSPAHLGKKSSKLAWFSHSSDSQDGMCPSPCRISLSCVHVFLFETFVEHFDEVNFLNPQ